MMQNETLDIIKRSASIPSMPLVATRCYEMTQNSNCDYNQLVELLSTDPGIAAGVLRLANSPLFGVTRQVSSLKHAIALLGVKRIRELVLARYLVQKTEEMACEHIDISYYWRLSVTTAILSSKFADALLPQRRDEAFMEVVDDVKAGKVLKAKGFVSDALPGEQLVRVRWQQGFFGVIRGLEKNAFAGAGYSLFKGIGGALALAVIGVGPIVGLALADWPWSLPFWVWGGVVVSAYGYSAFRLDASPLIGLTAPLVAPALAFAVLRSVVLTQVRGGVRWRGTFYPLAELKAGMA